MLTVSFLTADSYECGYVRVVVVSVSVIWNKIGVLKVKSVVFSYPILPAVVNASKHSMFFFTEPSLRTLCKLAVIQYRLDQTPLPKVLK